MKAMLTAVDAFRIIHLTEQADYSPSVQAECNSLALRLCLGDGRTDARAICRRLKEYAGRIIADNDAKPMPQGVIHPCQRRD